MQNNTAVREFLEEYDKLMWLAIQEDKDLEGKDTQPPLVVRQSDRFMKVMFLIEDRLRPLNLQRSAGES